MKSLKHYFLIFAISSLPFISVFATPLSPHTHDSPVHLARMAAYYKAISEGQILPRWAGELNYGYGMPLFNFIYHVPYLVTSLPIALGSSLVLAFKIALLVSYILSGLLMYAFTLRFFRHEGKAFIATMLYQFAPFHLVDLVVRGDVAEGFALAFLPLVLLTLLQGNPLLIGLSSLLLITSHNSMSLVFFGISCVFALLFSKNKIKSMLGLGLGLSLSAFYWLPALIERKYTYGDLFMKEMYLTHFAPLQNFFIPNLNNSDALLTGGVAVSFGLVHVAAIVAAGVLLYRKKIQDNNKRVIMWFALTLTAVSLILMQPVSKFLWTTIPILRMFQFPWRFLNVTTFSLALIGATVLVRKKTPLWFMMGISFLTILTSITYFRPPLGFDPIDEKYFWDYPLNTTYFGETDVIWSAGPAGSYPEKRFEIIGGNGTIENPIKKGTEHTFTVQAQSEVQIVDKTQYFPGWRVQSGRSKVPIEFQDQNWRGLITFRLPTGTHNVRVIWGKSPIRQIAEAITLVSLIGMVTVLGYGIYKTNKHV